MTVDVAVLDPEIVKFAVATGPLPIAFVFNPERMHLYWLADALAQEIVFPAAVADDPAVTFATVTSDGVNVNVHCRAADCCPFDV
jgi:hypothetical protein